MKHSFSISEALSFGWNTFKKNWKFWTIAMIFAMAIGGSFGGLNDSSSSRDNDNQKQITSIRDEMIVRDELMLEQNKLNEYPIIETPRGEKSNESLGWALAGVLMLLALPAIILAVLAAMFSAVVLNCLNMGHDKLCLDAVRGNELRYETLLSIVDIKKSLKYLSAGFLYFLIVFIGFFLLVVPGIYWAMKYQFFYLGIVDKNYGIFDSFKYSARLTAGVKFKLLGYALLVGGLFVVGLLALFIGAFFVAIVVSLSSIYIYETLRKQLEEENVSTEAVQVAVN